MILISHELQRFFVWQFTVTITMLLATFPYLSSLPPGHSKRIMAPPGLKGSWLHVRTAHNIFDVPRDILPQPNVPQAVVSSAMDRTAG